jgi:hypothetical protein
MEPTIDESSDDAKRRTELIVEQAHAIIDAHSLFRGRASQFDFACRNEVLTVRGAVPTFYLKQVLQSALKEVGGVRVIDNQVAVVSIENGR